MPTTGVDMSGLPAKLRDYSLRESETLLTKILIDGLKFLEHFELMVDVTDEVNMTEAYVDSVLQPGNKDDFSPKGQMKFKTRIGKVRSCKVDYRLTPKQITAMWKSYIGRIAKSKRGNVYDVPFQDFIFGRIVSKLREELHLESLFKGVYDESKQRPDAVFDGLLPLLSDAGIIPAQNIFAGAPVTQANAIDQLEGVADKVPSQLINTELCAFVEPDIAKFYNRDYRSSFGNNTSNTGGFEHTMLDGTQIMIVPEVGLAQTGAILITPKENFKWLTDNLGKTDAFIVEKRQRNIELMIDFDASTDLAIAEYVWCNDLALAKGAALRAAAPNRA